METLQMQTEGPELPRLISRSRMQISNKSTRSVNVMRPPALLCDEPPYPQKGKRMLWPGREITAAFPLKKEREFWGLTCARQAFALRMTKATSRHITGTETGLAIHPVWFCWALLTLA